MVSANNRLESVWRPSPSPLGVNCPTLQTIGSRACAAVDERPVAVTFLVFGIGLGLGVACAMMLREALSESETIPQSATRQGWDMLSRALPEAITRQFQA